MQPAIQLLPARFYHIYNRGNNREDLFRSERDYRRFLGLYPQHISPVIDTYCYCLMRNHFHLLVRVKSELEWRAMLVPEAHLIEAVFDPSQHFSNLFNAYAKWFNAVHQRTGSLFEERFKRIEVASDAYLTNLIFYIHFNPQKHGFVNDFRDWPWSSYPALVSNARTRLQRQYVLDWFDGREKFDSFHRGALDERMIAALIDGDFD